MIGTEVTAFSRQDWGVGRGGAGTHGVREEKDHGGWAGEASVSALWVVGIRVLPPTESGRQSPTCLSCCLRLRRGLWVLPEDPASYRRCKPFLANPLKTGGQAAGGYWQEQAVNSSGALSSLREALRDSGPSRIRPWAVGNC